MARRPLRQSAADTPLARWLVALAEKRGWTSGRQAAKYLGVNQAAFATWLRGEHTPDDESQQQLVEASGESPETIARLALDSRLIARHPTERGRNGPVAPPALSGTLPTHFDDDLLDRIAARVSHLFPATLPDHFPPDDWPRLGEGLVAWEVDDVGLVEGVVDGGEPGLGGRKVYWKVRVGGRSGGEVIVERSGGRLGDTVAVVVGDGVVCKHLAVLDGDTVFVADDGSAAKRADAGKVLGVVRFVQTPRRSAVITPVR